MRWLFFIWVHLVDEGEAYFGFFVDGVECFSQTLNEIRMDTLNQFDSKGKKNGYWIELINQKLEPIKKKKKASFFRYVYYEQGFQLDNSNHHIIRKVVLDAPQRITKGNPVLLNGEYKLYVRNKLGSIEHYTNGRKSGIHRSYNTEDNKIIEYVDYDKKYNNQEHTYYVMFEEMENDEFKFKGYYRNGEKGWGFYRE